MELSFTDRETVWRGRGRPPAQAPQEILDLLLRTYRTGEVGMVTVGEHDTESDIRELLAMLRAGARQLGRRVKIQHKPELHAVLFELADAPPQPREA